MELKAAKVTTTISNLKTGEKYKTEEEWKAKGIDEKDIRRDVHVLLRLLRELDPALDIAMTTNGVLLQRHAEMLLKSGLSRVTVSLDAVEEELFQTITDSKNTPSQIFEGIDLAQQIGLTVKVNCVVKKGVNESQIVPLANA